MTVSIQLVLHYGNIEDMEQDNSVSHQQSNLNRSDPQLQIQSFAAAHARRYANSLLATGEVIALPTDTVYGLMCCYDSDRGVKRLYTIKGRPQEKAIPILVSDRDQLAQLISISLPGLALELADRFWPGPLSIVLPAHPTLSPILTAGGQTVAVRMPDHDLLRELMDQCGPLAATSANLSGRPDTHTAAEVADQLGDRIPLILEDDEAKSASMPALPSTVVDLSNQDKPRILRPGPLAARVEMVIGRRC